MEHVIFCDGNQKTISWVIQTGNSIVEQKRDHADMYIDQITEEQSKYIALHVGIFWAIGVFIIKNNDDVKIMLDSKSMYEHFSKNTQTSDPFIEIRTGFIKQLTEQRKLNLRYQLIDARDNVSSKLL